MDRQHEIQRGYVRGATAYVEGPSEDVLGAKKGSARISGEEQKWSKP